HGELNLASVVSELEGIRYQVAEDFIDAIRVPVYGLWKSVGHRHVEANAALVGKDLECFLEVVEESAQLDRADIELPPSGLEPGDVEQLSHQAAERLGLLLECLGDVPLLVGERTVQLFAQQLGIAEN